MDEGWAKDNMDPFTPNPAVDLFEIIKHGNEKGVGVGTRAYQMASS